MIILLLDLQDLRSCSAYSVDGALRWRFSEAMPQAIHTLLIEVLRKSQSSLKCLVIGVRRDVPPERL